MLTGMSLSGNPADQRVEQHYRYDADGRLESVTSPQRPELNEHYTYDASGNITEKTVAGETVRMTYDLANQIVSRHSNEGLRTFDYDDADLGAHVFPYRNYRADLGRWMSADPVNFPDGPNQHYYAPVPTIGVDPWGLEEYLIFDRSGTYFTWAMIFEEFKHTSTSVQYTDSYGDTISTQVGVSVGTSGASIAGHLGIEESQIVSGSISQVFEWVETSSSSGSTGTNPNNFSPYVPENYHFNMWIVQPLFDPNNPSSTSSTTEDLGQHCRAIVTNKDYEWLAKWQVKEN